jgi:hypothetical protein
MNWEVQKNNWKTKHEANLSMIIRKISQIAAMQE